MLRTFSPADYADLFIIVSGAVLCLKKVAEMERYHMLRVVVLTSILSYFVVLFFIGYGFTLGYPLYTFDCVIEFSEQDVKW